MCSTSASELWADIRSSAYISAFTARPVSFKSDYFSYCACDEIDKSFVCNFSKFLAGSTEKQGNSDRIRRRAKQSGGPRIQLKCKFMYESALFVQAVRKTLPSELYQTLEKHTHINMTRPIVDRIFS